MMAKTARWMVVSVALAAGIGLAGAAMAADDAGKVDINTASKAQLTTLNGVGDALAGRILEYREKKGPFARPEDIKKVKGIGAAIFEKNQDRIIVGTPEPVEDASQTPPEEAATSQEDKPKS